MFSLARPISRQQLKMLLQKLFTLLYKMALDVNIFPARNFSSHIDRNTSKRYGQLATRLYIILLTIGLSILTFYTAFQPQLLKKTIDQPSLSLYNRLLLDHGNALRCPCSIISSVYNRYISIKPVFHQVT